MRRRVCALLLRSLRDEAQGFAGSASASPDGGRKIGSLAVRNTGLKKGPGGRSSISGVTATVFGSTGFLGRYVVNSFAKAGTQMVIPYRCDDIDMQHLRQMGDLGQIVQLPDFDIRDEDQIRHAISRSSIVINLVGAQMETWNFSFQDVHVDAAQRIARIAAESPNCERLVHVSALGASEDAHSERLRTKAKGDKAVQEAFPDVSILRPSYMIGSEDRLFNNIADLGKNLPFVPLVDGGDTRFQPVYVRDVADAIVEVLKTRDTCGKIYHLAGPEIITMRDAVDLVFNIMREKQTSMLMPSFVAKALVYPIHTLLHKRIPMPLSNHFMTADFIDELSKDTVLPEDVANFSHLGIDPRKVTEGVPVEHIRSYRSGGYDAGATAGTEGA
eukprot:evm.model.scf_924.6 EVM.evm.TU.scf_924.6   scf_924:37851-40740(-)